MIQIFPSVVCSIGSATFFTSVSYSSSVMSERVYRSSYRSMSSSTCANVFSTNVPFSSGIMPFQRFDLWIFSIILSTGIFNTFESAIRIIFFAYFGFPLPRSQYSVIFSMFWTNPFSATIKKGEQFSLPGRGFGITGGNDAE